MAQRTCSIDGCNDPVHGHGWCSKHWQRWAKRGTPDVPSLDPDLSGESWLPIPGYEGCYEVSNLGRVRSLPRNTTFGRILAQDILHAGHRRVTLYRDGRRSRIFVHRLVLLAFVGPCPEGMECRHLNGDSADNRLANLTYGTRSENTLDDVRHGKHRNARKTHCIRNHEYTPENTYVGPDGSRKCRTCAREDDRKRRAA